MRVSLVVAAALLLLAQVGCSSTGTSSSSWNMFSKKDSRVPPSSLTNAPPAPSFASSGAQPPAQPTGPAYANMPMHPGTNYPVTPYAAPQLPGAAGGQPAYVAQAPAAQGGYAPPAAPPPSYANPYAAPGGQAPPPQTPHQGPHQPAYPPGTPTAPYGSAPPGSYAR